MNLKIKKLNPNAITPTRGSSQAAGNDLYACLEKQVIVIPGATVKVPTGLAMAIPIGYAGFIYARSGLATKQGLRPSNCVGVVDSDYRGEVIVALYNDSEEYREVKHGDRIAQLVVSPVANVEIEESDELNGTERGDGGFGSTGMSCVVQSYK